MGISTYQSYCGAQIFDAIGLELEVRRAVLHRHRHDDRGRRARRDRRRNGGAPPWRLQRRPGAEPRARRRRRIHVPHPRRGAYVDAGRRGDIAACGAPRLPGDLQGVLRPDQRRGGAGQDHSRPVHDPHRRSRRAPAGAARRGRARRRHRQALFHRGDVVRFDQPRSAHHAGEGDEPDRRQVEHRRGRRGGRPLQAAAGRRPKSGALGDQAGGVRPLRRDGRIPRQLRHDADQGGAGGQAGRGRAIARPQGRRDDRQGAPLDAGRRADLAAAASRHLFDRGSGAADLRPEERQSGGRRFGQAGLGGRRRHGRGGRRQGAGRPHHHCRL